MVGPITTALYRNSPDWLQDVAVSTYGWKLRYSRYGFGHSQERAFLSESDRFDRDSLVQLQNRMLRETIRRAVTDVPYYRDNYRLSAADISQLTVTEMHRQIPTLPKSTVRAAPNLFLSDRIKPTTFTQTSGSTGSPLQVAATKAAIRRNYAFFARFLSWHGVSPFDESATFAGRMLVGSPNESGRKWRRNAAMHDTLFSSYHLTNDQLLSYIKQLEYRQPIFIDAYPSSIHRVAHFLRSEGIRHRIKPRVIVTSSETLMEHQRALVESVFACPVRDQYGSAEMVGFIAECQQGRLHVAPEYGVVEIVDANGRPVPTGVTGQLCLTGFINSTMPLIRYLIGDVARLSSIACHCGRASPTIDSIEGRVDDILVTPNGRHVGRLDPAFKGVVGIKESQIIQTGPATIIVKVVRSDEPGFDPGVLIRNLIDRLGNEMQITFEYVDAIPRDANGKFRSVKSLLS